MKTLSELEWNFDNVPDNELVACCYWEYARASAFLRELRKRSWEHRKPYYLTDTWWDEPANEKLHADLQKVRNIGYPAEVFLGGIDWPPEGALPGVLRQLKPDEIHFATGSFPKPWQGLARGERAHRAKINNDIEARQLVPFKRGFFLHANEIAKLGPSHSWTRKQLLEIRPSVIYGSGVEMTVVGINWSAFTNDEIANYFRRWVKANRPQEYPVPSRKGHKPGDWRANLTRLGVMRLLSRFSALEIVRLNSFPAVWETKQFSGRKWGDFTKWRDARREAGQLFHKLFRFLPADEKPILWERQAPGK